MANEPNEFKLSKSALKAACKQDFRFFCRWAFRSDPNCDPPEHMLDWINFVETNEHACILGPREHGKTWVFGRYILWRIIRNPSIKIILVSETLDLAKKIIRFPKIQFEENKIFQSVFGDMKTDIKWSDNEIIVKRDNIEEAEDTVYGVGILGQVVGRRSDLIIIDDPIDVRRVSGESMLNRMFEWIFVELFGTLGAEGKMVVIGSRKGHGDLYEVIEKKYPWIQMKVDKAIIQYEEKDDEGNIITPGQTLWPKKWSYTNAIKRKSQMDPYFFALNFQNEATTSENKLIQACDVDRAIDLDSSPESFGELGGKYAMGVDFAVEDDPLVAKKKDTDYFSVTVMRMLVTPDGETKHKVVYTYRNRGMKPEEQENKVKEVASRFKPMLIYCEANGFQRMYTSNLTKKNGKNPHITLPIKPYIMSKTKWCPVTGVPTLRQRFLENRFIIPYGGKLPEFYHLAHELRTFEPELPPNEHDDNFISFFLADRAAIDSPKFYKKLRIGVVGGTLGDASTKEIKKTESPEEKEGSEVDFKPSDPSVHDFKKRVFI